MQVLKVSAKTEVARLAGAIANILREEGEVELQSIGAGALNQSIKAVATARGFLVSGGFDAVCIPSFVQIDMDGEERTAMKLLVIKK